MINRKKLHKLFFFTIFINCCIVLCLTSISISTDYWVIAKPVRIEQYKQIKAAAASTAASQEIDDTDYDSFEEESALLPIDPRKNCKRYHGKIRFGLFKGVWLLNYAYGCKNRINRVSMIEILRNHKLFDQTLWLSTVLCCSLGLIATFISSIFSLLHVFLTSDRARNPISLYLWHSVSAIFHLLAIVLFALEYNIFIRKNVLTKEELESGWISLNRTQLYWSYYILIVSLILVCVNILIIYSITRFKRSTLAFKTQYDVNMKGTESDGNLVDESSPNNLTRSNELRSSKKIKKLIEFVY